MNAIELATELDRLIQDDDLTDEKLRDASEGLLPAISDYLHGKGQSAYALSLIACERDRQIVVEGWTPDHDYHHWRGELALAAAVYAIPQDCRSIFAGYAGRSNVQRELWPFEWHWFKPTPEDRIRELVKAGALIVAEIERLQAIEKEAQP